MVQNMGFSKYGYRRSYANKKHNKGNNERRVFCILHDTCYIKEGRPWDISLFFKEHM